MSQIYTTGQIKHSNLGSSFQVCAHGIGEGTSTDHKGLEILIGDPHRRSLGTVMEVSKKAYPLAPGRALIFNPQEPHIEKFSLPNQTFSGLVLSETLLQEIFRDELNTQSMKAKLVEDATVNGIILRFIQSIRDHTIDESSQRAWLDGFVVELALGLEQKQERQLVKAYSASGEESLSVAREVARLLTFNFQDSEFGLSNIEAIMGLTKFHIIRSFKKIYRMTPHQFVLNLRINFAKACLGHSDQKVVDVAFESGFADLRNFNKAFAKKSGTSPLNYRMLNNRKQKNA